MSILYKSILVSIFLLAVFINSKTSTVKTTHASTNHFFRHMSNHNTQKQKTWFGPFRLVSDVTYLLYLDTKENSTVSKSAVVVNNQSTVDTQTWYFHKLADGNFSVYNKGAQLYLTLTPDLKSFVVSEYLGTDHQRFYVRSFWNGYTINSQIALGYYNYVTVTKNGTVKSQYYNGNPKTQFFQLLGTDVLTLV